LAAHRPGLDVDRVATGEIWYGSDALAKGLVDELGTSDEYILKQYKDGAQVFSVKLVQRKQSWREALEVFSSVSALETLVHGIVLNAVSVSPQRSLSSLIEPTFVESHPSSHSIGTGPRDSTYIPRAF
jgi:ClpP class serine protease